MSKHRLGNGTSTIPPLPPLPLSLRPLVSLPTHITSSTTTTETSRHYSCHWRQRHQGQPSETSGTPCHTEPSSTPHSSPEPLSFPSPSTTPLVARPCHTTNP
ncbi:hypothetical protein GE21DRAFT_1029339 [Neurospora crassa]|nr:hypothetical protein GE21DRAFT_1029339 [Neurospora crassa]